MFLLVAMKTKLIFYLDCDKWKNESRIRIKNLNGKQGIQSNRYYRERFVWASVLRNNRCLRNGFNLNSISQQLKNNWALSFLSLRGFFHVKLKIDQSIFSDLITIRNFEFWTIIARKKRQLEPDMVGAKLASSAKCVAQFQRDAIFRNHDKELVLFSRWIFHYQGENSWKSKNFQFKNYFYISVKGNW